MFRTSGYPAERATQVTIRTASGGQLLSTGALKVSFGSTGRVSPFASVGAGVASRFGRLPRAVLEHRYYFRTGPSFPYEFEEIDLVAVRVTAPSHRFTAVVGGGLDVQPGLDIWRRVVRNTSRWGIRIEGRVFLSGAATDTLLNAYPSLVTTTERYGPNDGLASTVFLADEAAAIQFSNDPRVTGFESTLNGSSPGDVRMFEARGIRCRVVSWAGLCPHLEITAGKRLSTRLATPLPG